VRFGYFKQLQNWRWFSIGRHSTNTYIRFGKFFVRWDKKPRNVTHGK